MTSRLRPLVHYVTLFRHSSVGGVSSNSLRPCLDDDSTLRVVLAPAATDIDTAAHATVG